jgi:hypothetical protein
VVTDADADGNGDGGRSGVRLSACAVLGVFFGGGLLEACVSLLPELVDLDIGIQLFLSDVCQLVLLYSGSARFSGDLSRLPSKTGDGGTMHSDKMSDEKLESATVRDGSVDGQQVDGRRVLRRLDVRFVFLPSFLFLSQLTHQQHPPRSRPPIPLLLHRPHKCRQCAHPRPRERHWHQ